MMGNLRAAALVACLALTASGTAVSAYAGSAGRPSRAFSTIPHIIIMNFGYTGTLTVRPGVRVSVTNNDSVRHTLTDKITHLFDTGTVPRNGGVRTFTAPSRPGSYPFGCNFHPDMAGTLVVTRHRTAFTAPHAVTITRGQTIRVTARLMDTTADRPIGGATVVLLRRAGTSGSFHRVRTLVTASRGRVRAAVRPLRLTQYQWHFAATRRYRAATSVPETVHVK